MTMVVMETGLTDGAVGDNDADGSPSGEDGRGVGLIELVGHHVTVVEVEMERAIGEATVGGGVRWAEPRPLCTAVEGDHCDVGGAWGGALSDSGGDEDSSHGLHFIEIIHRVLPLNGVYVEHLLERERERERER